MGTDVELAADGGTVPGRGPILREFFSGVGFLLKGLRMYARSPRLMLLGLIPALIAALVLVAAFVAAAYYADDVVDFTTPYADQWSAGVRDSFRVVVTIALIGVWLIVSVLAYTAVTLLIGEPFYEAISKRVDDQHGGVPGEVDVKFWRAVPHSVIDSLRLLIFTTAVGIPLFFSGFIPVVGETVVPVLGAMLGGWVLVLELTGVAFERRGLRFRARRAALRQRRAMALGFGVATFICFLIPFAAIVLMPAAVAGATLLTRRVSHLPT